MCLNKDMCEIIAVVASIKPFRDAAQAIGISRCKTTNGGWAHEEALQEIAHQLYNERKWNGLGAPLKRIGRSTHAQLAGLRVAIMHAANEYHTTQRDFVFTDRARALIVAHT